MNGDRFLVDTNIILGYLKGTAGIISFFDAMGEAELYASVITRMELFSFHGMSETEELLVRRFFDSIKVVPLTEDVENATVALRRATRCKLPDAIIAASAVCLEATLLTCDKTLAATQFPGLKITIPV